MNKKLWILVALAACWQSAIAGTVETLFFLSDDLRGGIHYFSSREGRPGNMSFLFDRGFQEDNIMYARPENYAWYAANAEGVEKKRLLFRQTASYAYLRRESAADIDLKQINDTTYTLTVDGSECIGGGCNQEENIVSVVMPKRFKVLDYDASVAGNWRVVDSTYSFYSRNVKGASVSIRFEDRFALLYSMLQNQLGRIEGVEIKNQGSQIQVVMPMDHVFDSGGVQIQSEGVAWVNKLAVTLKDASYKELRVEGHADNSKIRKVSVYPSNWELSAARAAAALRLLVAAGVAPQKLAAVGYGDSRPIADNDSPVGRARNRRIEFTLVPEVAQN